jgi:membrane-associated phospholipid phosphatase
MEDVRVTPQPGSPEKASRLLPLGGLGAYLALGALVIVVATLTFAWIAKGVFANNFVAFDDGVITWLHGYWSPAANLVMLFFTTMGDLPALALLLGMVAVTLWSRGRWIDAAGLILAGAGAGILNQLMKGVFQRVRPDLIPSPFHLTSYSFPSGHSMGSIACYGMLAFVITRLLRRPLHRALVIVAAALIIFCVGLSRIYFGVHYPTDVLGGFLAGGAWLVLCVTVVEAAEWHAQRRQQAQGIMSTDRTGRD